LELGYLLGYFSGHGARIKAVVIPLKINMMIKPSIAILFASLSVGFLAYPSLAQTKPNCKNPMTQVELNFCAAEAAKASDRELNQMYRQVRAKYKGTSQDNRLVTAQLAWIKFRDAECALSAGRYEGGSSAPMANRRCVDRLTQQRTKDLAEYLEEG